MKINKRYKESNEITLYNGDCYNLLQKIKSESVDLIITSPPYCMGKAYEDPKDDIESFKNQQIKIFPEIYRILKVGGSVCWQVGYHICDMCTVPLDFYVYQIFSEMSSEKKHPLLLRNRIIWTFGHGLNTTQRFSGRHETILWFTKGKTYDFNLDGVRVPQKYPGKRAYKGEKKGEFSGNPQGKNPSDVWEVPSDVWDIPNVKANHIEKTEHPCQFPSAIPRRLIKALVPENGVVCDPYMGVGTSGIAAVFENRKFIGAELKKEYYELAIQRIKNADKGKLEIRPDVPVIEPSLGSEVARLPEEFAIIRGHWYGGQEEKKE